MDFMYRNEPLGSKNPGRISGVILFHRVSQLVICLHISDAVTSLIWKQGFFLSKLFVLAFRILGTNRN